MKKFAVIVAGGSGARMGSATPKQFLLLNKKPIIWYSIHAFLQAFNNNITIVLVLPKNHLAQGKKIAKMFNSPIQLVVGGETRFQSVKNGLHHVSPNSMVFVHDGVRCLVTPEIIHNCYRVALTKGNAIPSITAIDSMRWHDKKGNKSLKRDNVKLIQTPQTFKSNVLLKAFTQPFNPSFTDEATVVESLGKKIHLCEGSYENIKITTPIDLNLAKQILANRNTKNKQP